MNKQLIAVAALVAFAASSQAAVTNNTVSFKLKGSVDLKDTLSTNKAGVVTAKGKTQPFKIINTDFTGGKKNIKITKQGNNFMVDTNVVGSVTFKGVHVGSGSETYSYVITTNNPGTTNATVSTNRVTQTENTKYTRFITLSLNPGTNSFTVYGLDESKYAESKKKEATSDKFTGVGQGNYGLDSAIVEGTVSSSESIKK